QHFIHVASVYSAKNILYKNIINALKPLDGTLCESKQVAIKTIDRMFNHQLTTYIKSGGKAMPPNYSRYEFDSGIGIGIENVIIIHIFKVNRLLEEADVTTEELFINNL